MRNVFLLCEGSDNSLDTRVIDALVIQRFAVNARVEPSRSENSLGPVREYLERAAASGTSPGLREDRRVFTVRDRNYLPLATAIASWNSPGKHDFIWQRHEIENYLLYPEAILRSLKDLAPGGHSYENTEAVHNLLVGVGRDLAEHHAGMMLALALVDASMRWKIRGFEKPVRIGPRKLFAKTSPPPTRTEWLTAISYEQRKFRRSVKRRRRVRTMTSVELRERYDKEYARILAPEYLKELSFLRDFDGKGLFQRLHSELKRIPRLKGLSRATLERELLKHLVDGVRDQSIKFVPDEFEWLAQRLIAAVSS